MSGANAIHGVILVGAIIVADHSKTTLELTLSTIAIVLATINMVGGFVVTDRMLQMFKGKPKEKKKNDEVGGQK
jgi:NAD(P) transhydrogenase subunit alpha